MKLTKKLEKSEVKTIDLKNLTIIVTLLLSILSPMKSFADTVKVDLGGNIVMTQTQNSDSIRARIKQIQIFLNEIDV